ncbi:HalOD1 output domain-containing protein [Halegenticoccus soli]|uniref:HalOD1 output domain-containing protein n=1 Tax=Halegenticoccus soli TaxID=1985678 RepID=UPI00117A35BF|nr:HalOD1 output domain-containing protein [Halegenticoccus soli]
MSSHAENNVTPEYNAKTGTYQIQYNPTDDITLSSLVVLATAEVIGADLETVCQSPLTGFITSDALNALFATPPDTDNAAAHVTFQYLSCDITIQGNGRITITPLKSI